MKVNTISFDIGGTLLISDVNDNQNQYNFKILSELVELPYEDVRVAYKDVFQKTKASFSELVEAFCKKLGINVTRRIIDFFEKKFNSTNENVYINPEAISVISELKKDGYTVILFSNNCCLMNSDAIKDIKTLVDGIFNSYDLGYTKSDSESYRCIEKALDILPEEILHIGDTLKSDYYEPISNGWNALYYGKTDDSSVNSIDSLNEIYSVLNRKYCR